MSLGDLFPDDFKNDFAKRNIDIGKALLIKINDFDVTYPKYIVIVANDAHNVYIATVIINTHINPLLFPTPYLKSLHVPIDQKSHPFLKYDSYVNCSEIKEFKTEAVLTFLKAHPERAVGNVSPAVL